MSVELWPASISQRPVPGMIQRRAGCPCGGSCPRCRRDSGSPPQGNLRIGPVDDPAEREAEHVADAVMRNPHARMMPVRSFAPATEIRGALPTENDEVVNFPGDTQPLFRQSGSSSHGQPLKYRGIR
jgi:hypothetical protein